MPTPQMRSLMASEPTNDDLLLRDRLAIDRTVLANERTLLAYVRTAVMLVVTGATAIKFFGDRAQAVGSGWLLVAFGLATAAIGARRFAAVRRQLRGAPEPPR